MRIVVNDQGAEAYISTPSTAEEKKEEEEKAPPSDNPFQTPSPSVRPLWKAGWTNRPTPAGTVVHPCSTESVSDLSQTPSTSHKHVGGLPSCAKLVVHHEEVSAATSSGKRSAAAAFGERQTKKQVYNTPEFNRSPLKSPADYSVSSHGSVWDAKTFLNFIAGSLPFVLVYRFVAALFGLDLTLVDGTIVTLVVIYVSSYAKQFEK